MKLGYSLGIFAALLFNHQIPKGYNVLIKRIVHALGKIVFIFVCISVDIGSASGRAAS